MRLYTLLSMLKHSISLFVFFIISLLSSAQTPSQIVDSFFKLRNFEYAENVIHGPLTVDIGTIKGAVLFFVGSWNKNSGDNDNYGVLYNRRAGLYTQFGHNEDDYSYANGVISVFTENIDHTPDKELIVISQTGGRTFYADGGYSGIQVYYQTRVFKVTSEKTRTIIKEYKTMGELLTVNFPRIIGTKAEEEVIGRELENIYEICGVTYNAQALKSRIRHFKSKGLLGGLQ